jgi:hypothetical protein
MLNGLSLLRSENPGFSGNSRNLVWEQCEVSSSSNTNYMKAFLPMFPDSEEEAKEVEIIEVCPGCLHTKIKRSDGKIQWVMPGYIRPIAGNKGSKS